MLYVVFLIFNYAMYKYQDGNGHLKCLLHHKMNNAVTAGYIMKDVERLRKSMQQVTNFLVKHMNQPVTHSLV